MERRFFRTRADPQTLSEIARNLAVRYQVEGNVRQTGDRVRVNAQLVDTNGQVLWSASFDEALADVFSCKTRSPRRSPGHWRSA